MRNLVVEVTKENKIIAALFAASFSDSDTEKIYILNGTGEPVEGFLKLVMKFGSCSYISYQGGIERESWLRRLAADLPWGGTLVLSSGLAAELKVNQEDKYFTPVGLSSGYSFTYEECGEQLKSFAELSLQDRFMANELVLETEGNSILDFTISREIGTERVANSDSPFLDVVGKVLREKITGITLSLSGIKLVIEIAPEQSLETEIIAKRLKAIVGTPQDKIYGGRGSTLTKLLF